MLKIVTKQLIFHHFTKGACIAACSLFSFISSSNAANEFITGFQMSSCSQNKCNNLTVPGKVEKGPLAPIYAFGKSKVVQRKKLDKSMIILNASEGYYNHKSSEIVLRGVRELGDGESLIDLKTGEIKIFPKQ